MICRALYRLKNFDIRYSDAAGLWGKSTSMVIMGSEIPDTISTGADIGQDDLQDVVEALIASLFCTIQSSLHKPLPASAHIHQCVQAVRWDDALPMKNGGDEHWGEWWLVLQNFIIRPNIPIFAVLAFVVEPKKGFNSVISLRIASGCLKERNRLR